LLSHTQQRTGRANPTYTSDEIGKSCPPTIEVPAETSLSIDMPAWNRAAFCRQRAEFAEIFFPDAGWHAAC
jgi:hypothetical protein